tara:strand:+ start:6718 stop:6981 length:264 start_codon:yes stop_codon:yes gene_type:complete
MGRNQIKSQVQSFLNNFGQKIFDDVSKYQVGVNVFIQSDSNLYETFGWYQNMDSKFNEFCNSLSDDDGYLLTEILGDEFCKKFKTSW